MCDVTGYCIRVQSLDWLWGMLLQLWCEELGDWLVFHGFAECFSDVNVVGWFLEVIRDWFVVSFVLVLFFDLSDECFDHVEPCFDLLWVFLHCFGCGGVEHVSVVCWDLRQKIVACCDSFS